jgi:gluconolactonase
MTQKTIRMGRILLAATFFLCSTAAFAQRGGGRQGGGFGQPEPQREVTVTAIPGVVAAGAKWTLAWQGTDNADGIIATKDGGLLFAQEQPNRISKLDKNDKASSFLEDTHGTGALAIDSKGHIFSIQRTCTDPGGHPDQCTEATKVAILSPQRKTITDNFDGKSLGRLNDLIVDKKGGVYFNGAGTHYVNAAGRVISIGENIRTNGIMLSRDEKTLYVTNGATIVAFDVQPDGSVKNQRDFAKLEGGGTGDGMAIDSEGRLYVTSQPGVQVLSPEGKYLGLIPTPRQSISAAFTGPDKKTLYIVGAGALGADGKEFRTPEGVRNNAKSIYKISMVSRGFKGRVK